MKINNKKMVMNTDGRPLMVTVMCCTYNHSAFIVDALNGFCMQETSFPFVCAVIDDASTDGEQNVIKNYFRENFDLEDNFIVRNEETNDYILSFARHKTNLNCFFAVFYLKYNHYSIKKSVESYIARWCDECQYIALCEGDDYWIDPLKLQKQVDELEAHLDITCVYTGFQTVDEKGQIYRRPFYEACMLRSHSGNNLLSLFCGNYIMTLTTMYRKDILCSPIYRNCPLKYDYALEFAAATYGDFVYLPSITGCYRMNMKSISISQKELLDKGLWIVYKYFAKHVILGDVEHVTCWDSFRIRLHVLIHSLRVDDLRIIKELTRRDFLSAVLYPCCYIFYKIKWRRKSQTFF